MEMQMMYKKLIIGICLAFLCVGCGLTERVVEKEQKSMLWFTGRTNGAIAYIDNGDPIELKAPMYDERSDKKFYYEVKPGKHNVVVKRDGVVVVNRDLLLGNGIVKEIEIP
jgi:hypothetical protein